MSGRAMTMLSMRVSRPGSARVAATTIHPGARFGLTQAAQSEEQSQQLPGLEDALREAQQRSPHSLPFGVPRF